MGSFSSSQKQTSNQTQNSTATTTPNAPGWLQEPTQDFINQINALGSSTAPANANQQAAWASTGNLGNWQGPAQAASMFAGMAGLAGPNTAGAAQGYTAPAVTPTTLGGAPSVNPANMSATTFQAPSLAPSVNWNAPTLDINAIMGAMGGAPSVTAGQAGSVSVGPAAQSQAVLASAADPTQFISAFRDPYTEQVRDATLAQYDRQADLQRGQAVAEMAGRGMFGGSGSAIYRAELEGGLGRDRAAIDANLLSDAHRFGVDAAFRRAAGLDAVSALNANLGTQNNQFNAGQTNDNSRLAAQLAAQIGIANAGNATQASIAQGGLSRDYDLAGLDARLRAAMSNQEWGGRAASDAAAAENARRLAQGGYDYGAASQNAGAANDAARTNAGFQQEANMFGANTLARFMETQAQMDQQRRLADAGFSADASRFTADANNRRAEFDAGQADSALARALEAAGVFGNISNLYGANSRADIGLTADLGQQQWEMDRYMAEAPYRELAQRIAMFSGLNPESFFGQTVNSSGTSTGTQRTSSSPSMFSSLLGLGSLFSEPDLKTDIEQVGVRGDGLGVYDYRYHWDEPGTKRTGVMADEVEALRPDALGPRMWGARTVDYARLQEA